MLVWTRALFGGQVVNAQWLHYPDSERTTFVVLNRLDFLTPQLFDTDALMDSILSGVRDILKGIR